MDRLKSRCSVVHYRAVRGLGPNQLITSAGETGFFFIGDHFSTQKLHFPPILILISCKKCHEVVQILSAQSIPMP